MQIYPITVPGGSDGYIQYNNGGIFGGDSTFTLNDSTKMVTASGLTLNGTQTYGIDASGGTWSSGVMNWDADPDIYANGTNVLRIDGTNDTVIIGEVPTNFVPGTAKRNVIIGEGAGSSMTTATDCVYLGLLAGGSNLTSVGNFALGSQALWLSTADRQVAIGNFALSNPTFASNSVAIGDSAMRGTYGSSTHPTYDTAVGGSSARNIISGDYGCYFGYGSGYSITSGSSNVFFGYKSGYNQTTNSNLLIIDNQDRSSAANEAIQSLIYGVFNATPASQSVTINGDLNIRHHLAGIPDEITATDAGVAASLDTINTEVTTNGDADLDNVTLANGTSGQIKHIYCVVEGAVGDTWKITPATMVGGTQITFSTAGEGCTLVYADNEGWCVVANNGGTIT